MDSLLIGLGKERPVHKKLCQNDGPSQHTKSDER